MISRMPKAKPVATRAAGRAENVSQSGNHRGGCIRFIFTPPHWYLFVSRFVIKIFYIFVVMLPHRGTA